MRCKSKVLQSAARAVAGLLLASATGCHGEREKLPPEEPRAGDPAAVTVTAQPVSFQSVQRTVGLVGTLHGYEEISLSAKVEGRVRKISHDVADRVKPGEILLEIDPTDYQLNVRQAQKSLLVELAKLGLTELPAGKVDMTHIPTVIQAQLRRDNAQKRLERARQTVALKAAPEEELTEKMSDFRVAQAEYDNQILIARASLAAIQVKQEALSISRQQLQETVIRVPEPSQPVPGVDVASYAITSRVVAEGSYVQPGKELFKIVIERPLKFRGRVPERKSSEVQVGQKAMVLSSAYREPFPGEVTRINPSIDPQTRAFEVEIVVPNTQGQLKPGGFAKTAILTHVEPKVAVVPIEAPLQVAGVTKIFIIEGGHAKEKHVTLGVQGKHWVEVISPPLADGAMVVTSGQTAIANDTLVTVRAAAPSARPADTPDETIPTDAAPTEAPLAADGDAEHASGEAAGGPMARRGATP